MSMEDQVRFALAEEIMLEAAFKHADKDTATEIATSISTLLKDKNYKAENIVAAIYMLHSMHVKQSIKAIDELHAEPSKEQIPPWMQ